MLASVGAVAVLQLLFTFTPLMQTLFGTAAIGPAWSALIFMMGVLGFAAIELHKWAARRRRAQGRGEVAPA